MIELQLVGYTADLGHLVLDLKGNDGGRYRLVVEPDLFATLDELREARRAEGLAVGDLVEYAAELGIDIDELRRQQAEEQAALAAAGHVSSGATGLPDEVVSWLDESSAAGQGQTAQSSQAVAESTDEDDADDADDGDELDVDADPDPDDWDDLADVDADPDPDDAASDADDVEEDRADGFVTRLLDDRVAALDAADRRAPVMGSTVQVVPAPLTETHDTTQVIEDVIDSDDGLVDLLADAVEDPVLTDGPTGQAQDEPDADVETDVEEAAETVPAASAAGRKPPAPLVESTPRPTPPAPGSAVPVRRPPQPARVEALLTPKQIQDRLRAGNSVASVARAAGTDKEWIARWQQPILAERARILDQALELRLERARLGKSRYNLGESVRRNLATRKVPADEIEWTASRRRDGRWSVKAAYNHRGKKHSATWTYDADDAELKAASDAARDIGFVRRRS